jgi:hypothetical protein
MKRSLLVFAALLLPATAVVPSVHEAEAGPPQGHGSDFNNDGYADVVIGDGYDDVSAVEDSGSVWVMPGSAAGPRAGNVQRWSRVSTGISGDPDVNDYFGYVWATGNFNGDAFDDLAVCILGAKVAGVDDAGAVVVLFGSGTGLHGTGSKLFSRNTVGVPGAPTSGERWCEYGLASGDFTGDGRDELVVVSEVATVGAVNGAGSITVLKGSPTGPTGAGAVEITQNSASVPGAPETNGNLGSYGLGVGDFNGDGYDDLTVDIENLTVNGHARAGGFYTFFGGSTGLHTSGSQLITKATAGIPGAPEASGFFGYGHPAVADWNRDGYDDIVIPDPYATVDAIDNAGQVMLLRGSEPGLKGAGGKTIHQGSSDVPGAVEADDYFGYLATSAGDFNGDGRPDLVVGASYEDLGAETEAGAFYTFPGTATTIGTIGSKIWTQDTAGVLGSAKAGNQFSGTPSWSGDFNGDGYDDLVVALSYGDVGALDAAGFVMVFRGSAGGITATGLKSFRRGQMPGGTDEANGYFGYAL